ncbi:MAG: hypothetical protein HY925_02565 [Elusimicrobia bacterium]|nr:hypothetical protein [Elusimicrobiota bacterium]
MENSSGRILLAHAFHAGPVLIAVLAGGLAGSAILQNHRQAALRERETVEALHAYFDAAKLRNEPVEPPVERPDALGFVRTAELKDSLNDVQAKAPPAIAAAPAIEDAPAARPDALRDLFGAAGSPAAKLFGALRHSKPARPNNRSRRAKRLVLRRMP